MKIKKRKPTKLPIFISVFVFYYLKRKSGEKGKFQNQIVVNTYNIMFEKDA